MWFIYILLCIVLVIILLLCIPVDIAFSINTREIPKLKASLAWCYGIFKTELHKKFPSKEKAKKRKAPKPRRMGNLDFFVEIITTKGLLKQIFLFVRRTFKSMKIKELAADLEIGLDDPIDNAWLFAYAIPVNYFLARTSYHLNIRPVFAPDYYFSCNSAGRIRVFPIQMVGNILRLAFSSPGRMFIWITTTRKWKKSK